MANVLSTIETAPYFLAKAAKAGKSETSNKGFVTVSQYNTFVFFSFNAFSTASKSLWLDTSVVEPRDEAYEIYCTEYCGEYHSNMLAKVYITEVQNE